MKRFSKKSLTMALCVALALTLVIGGTLAYLYDVSLERVNTFEKSDIDVELTETDNNYQIIPGRSQDKDPTVVVTTPDTDAWCLIKVTDNTNGLVGYELADGWTAVPGHEGYYYRVVDKDDDPQEFPILKDNKVTYDPSITVAQLNALQEEAKLTFQAFVIQKDTDNAATAINTVEKAWQQWDNADLPHATLTVLDPTTVGDNGIVVDTVSGDEVPLDLAVEFATPDTAADVEGQEYQNWAVDFVLSFNKPVDGSDVYLFGSYSNWQNGAWLGATLEEGGINGLDEDQELKIMADWFIPAVFGGDGQPVTYNDVVTFVQDFQCGVHIANDTLKEDLVATLKLVMIDDAGNVHVITEQNFSNFD